LVAIVIFIIFEFTISKISPQNIKYSNASQTPTAPSQLSASTADNSVFVHWTDNASDETAYNVYWTTGVAKPSQAQAVLASNSQGYNITGLNPGTSYTVWIEAVGNPYNSASVSLGTQTTGQSLSEDFVFMVVPDTQFMVMNFSHRGSQYSQYTTQTQWIADQKDNLNIKFIAHVGDVVDHSDLQHEWDNFKSGWSVIEDSGIPWSIAPGNHDTNLPIGVGSWDKFNQEFPVFDFFGQPWFGEGYPATEYTNNLNFFEASGMEFMVISIGYGMNEDEYNWAKSKLQQYPNKRAIISAHDILYGRFKDLALENANVFMMVSGHYPAEEWHNTFTNNFGGTVHEIMSNYQYWSNGYLRYYEFKPSQNSIEAFTYKPETDESRSGSSSNFSWYYEMD
jgi:hypothetical protein